VFVCQEINVAKPALLPNDRVLDFSWEACAVIVPPAGISPSSRPDSHLVYSALTPIARDAKAALIRLPQNPLDLADNARGPWQTSLVHWGSEEAGIIA
jgi:hypothetical protein